ncbi:Zinc finger CCCH domain-containing protein 46 [Hibiscus syriacus]|uniref:Zinc finger CCCH domain-containing protein 46 n=1 Tax=Hibiscus syriacus TaxID=106335 RepID=A0A6A3AQH4_HIBSY|nr:Zinc finger CCCH domain-containing protein 46 [Hibiscus syriacus]
MIQDHGEKEMIRLAFGPEALLHSVILKAKKELGLPTTPSTLSSSPFLANNPNNVTFQKQTSCSSSKRLGSSGVNLPFLSIPSTFTGHDELIREEDVSNYFRIPNQQKRMLGFVTLVYPETVKILAKGNAYFVCDARVLVKPYKEKGKIQDKKQQMEREFSPCGTPTGIDLQQALDLQNRWLIDLQLLDVKKHRHQRGFSSGSPIPSPAWSPTLSGQSLVLTQFQSNQEALQENCSSPMPAIIVTAAEKQTASSRPDMGPSVCMLAPEARPAPLEFSCPIAGLLGKGQTTHDAGGRQLKWVLATNNNGSAPM